MQGRELTKDEKLPTKRQLTTLARRKHIVQSAAACFVERGFHQTSMRDIAEQAEVSLGNLYNHFESKTELIAEIAGLEADDLKRMHHLLEEDAAAPEVIDAFIIAYFEYVSRPENAVLTAEITAEAMRSPQIVESFSENRKHTIDAVTNVIGADAFSFPEQRMEMAEILLDLVESAASRVAFESKSVKASTLLDIRSIVGRLLST